MTIHYYNATLTNADGMEFHATIFWDKLRPRSMTAHICPLTGPAQCGNPVWSASSANSRTGMVALARKFKSNADAMGLRIVAEKETQYAAKLKETA